MGIGGPVPDLPDGMMHRFDLDVDVYSEEELAKLAKKKAKLKKKKKKAKA